MRTKIVLALTLACCVIFLISPNAMSAYADCQYRAEDIELENDVAFFKGAPLNGVLCLFHESGKLEAEILYKNGKREGLMKAYDEGGKLKAEITYKNDQMEGLAKTYYTNGKLDSEALFKNGKVEGLAKAYHESGKLLSEAFFKNGQLEGTEKIYHENGKPQFGITNKNGSAISGVCHHPDGRQVPLTSTEITNWNNGLTVSCP